MSNNERKVEVPIVQEEFAKFLRTYNVAKGGELCDTIAQNIAETGGALVFEDPEVLAKRLATWSEYIGGPLRKQIMEHWFAKKHIGVAPELLETAGVTTKTESALKRKQAKERKEAEGTVWTVDIDDSGLPRIRMIKDETEPGVTLTEAKAAAKEIGREGEQSIAVYNEELGRHMPNFKSPFVKQNIAAAWATARTMDKAMAEGQEVDPMDIWIDQQAKLMQLKEVMGVTPEAREKTPVGEIVSALKDLQEMAKEGKTGTLPEWISDPVAFIKTVQDVQGMGDKGGGGPSWLTDPAEFIKMVREITGDKGGDEAIKTQLADLTKTIETMEKERHDEQIASLQAQIRTQAESSAKQFDAILDRIEEGKRSAVGRTEMDILHEIATEGIGVVKTELPGLRSDLREAFKGGGLPSPKSAEVREERKGKYKKALETDRKIEELGKSLFYGETPTEEQ